MAARCFGSTVGQHVASASEFAAPLATHHFRLAGGPPVGDRGGSLSDPADASQGHPTPTPVPSPPLGAEFLTAGRLPIIFWPLAASCCRVADERARSGSGLGQVLADRLDCTQRAEAAESAGPTTSAVGAGAHRCRLPGSCSPTSCAVRPERV